MGLGNIGASASTRCFSDPWFQAYGLNLSTSSFSRSGSLYRADIVADDLLFSDGRFIATDMI